MNEGWESRILAMNPQDPRRLAASQQFEKVDPERGKAVAMACAIEAMQPGSVDFGRLPQDVLEILCRDISPEDAARIEGLTDEQLLAVINGHADL